MKKILIGSNIIAVVILILASLTNVVGYQSVQSSNKQIINEAVNQRELLFQTIVDIANNKEIQRIILKSQMNRGILPPSEIPIVTKNQIRQMYFIGLILSKIISESRIQSIIGKYQISNQETQKEIKDVIEKNPILKREITQLKDSECDCGNDNQIEWHFPVICILLLIIGTITGFLMMASLFWLDNDFLIYFFWCLYIITLTLAIILDCRFLQY